MDQLCPRIAEDAENIYTSHKALSAVENAAKTLGLPEKHVFPIVNYFNDRVTSPVKDRLAVEALYGMVRSAESYMEQNPELQKEDPLQEFYSHLAHVEADGNHQSIKEAVQTELEQLGEKSLRVLCVGAVNAGKSCFIDSINSAIAGSITCKASGGITLQMTDDSGNDVPSKKNIPYIVVLTKSDELSMAVADNTSELVQDKLVRDKRNALFRMFGFKENKVIPVINYIHQKRVVPEMDALLFDVFLEILKLGKQRLEDMEDPSNSFEEDSKEEVANTCTNTTN